MVNNELTKHTLFLRAGDMEYIASAMPKGKASFFIRKVIASAVDRMRAAERETKPEST